MTDRSSWDNAEYRAEHAAYMKEWRKQNPASYKAAYQRYFENHRVKTRQAQKKYRDHLRQQVIDHYGGKCQCCGETTREFLCIDHINGGGNEHRRQTSIWGGFHFTRWLIKHDCPDGFQVLCHNCNMAKGMYGTCPHNKPH